jgi:hypothetical protein
VSEPWKNRRQLLDMAYAKAVEEEGADQERLVLVPVVAATDAEYDRFLDAGGEGLMLKQTSSVYRPGARTKQWLKVKPTERALLWITRFLPKIRGPHARTELRDPEGHTIRISTPNPIMAMADKNPLPLIGRPVVVKYQIRTPDGSYRHPRADTERTLEMWKKR